MSDDAPLKSAYELALERLQRQDREAGVEEPQRLTEEQKRRIAELRSKAQAKLAEIEILHRDAVAASGGDPDKLRELEERLEIDRRRVESSVEAAVARVRRGETDSD